MIVDEEQHRKIRLAAAISGKSMSKFMRFEVLQAAEKATAGIDIPTLQTAGSLRKPPCTGTTLMNSGKRKVEGRRWKVEGGR